MKLVTLCLTLLLSTHVFSYELEQGGQIVYCNNTFDVQNQTQGYRLLSPAVEMNNEVLTIGLSYFAAICKNVNGEIGFVAKEKISEGDRILLENPRLFTTNMFYGKLGKTGNGATTFNIPVATILTKREAKKFYAGQSVMKTLYLHYGNHFAGTSENNPMNYGMSSGYYTLKIALTSNKASVVSFSTGRH